VKIHLEQTSRIVDVANPSYRARMWQGTTDDAIPIMALVVFVSPLISPEDPRQIVFEEALELLAEPHAEIVKLPLRLVL
jgi:hypothetical protein